MTSFMFANVTTAKTSADYIRLTRLAQSTLAGNLKVRIYSSQHLICSCSLTPQVYFCTSVIQHFFLLFCISVFQHFCVSVILYFSTSGFQHFFVSVILYFCTSGKLTLWDFGLPPCPQLSKTFKNEKNAHFCWKLTL